MTEMLSRARAAGACEEALAELDGKSWEEFLEHTEAAFYSYWYARNVLHGRFKAGEPAIAKVAYISYWYARDVIGGRFKAGEPAIAKVAETAYYYAADVRAKEEA